ncbi:nuclear pore complex assembly-domain-containing protein [Mycena polygramma]|nr:nuclear pore complex assembly-domain-containing protein [Mycena polygramma]
MDTTVSPAVLSYFDLSPEAFPWRDPRPQQIERRRAALADLLLFDILLTSGGISEPDTLYPPSDVDSFHRLLDAIQNSAYDALKRDCLVYFLLKWYQDGRDEKFRLERCIPPQFASLSDAYWHLDAGTNVPRAVSILSDARLNTDYASKILQAISLSPNSMPLILKYVRTAKPVLTEPDDIDLYAVALAHSSLLEAWQFQRTFSELNDTRSRLLKKILHWCFTPVPRRSALIQLLGIALTPYEQDLMQSYATPPSSLPPDAIATLQNLICVRLIQTGRYADAIKMDRRFSSAASVNLGLQAERTKMVQDIYAALPLAERAILDLELENPSITASTSGGTLMSASSSRDWDVSMSWEDIRPTPPAPIPALPSVPIPSFAAPPPVANGGRETPRSKFGGFGVQAANSVFSPLAFNASSSSALAPIIPVSNVPKGTFAAQPAVPSGRQSLNASANANAFSSLSQSAGRFTGSASSSANPQKSLFDSASRKQNAFYQPPPLPAAPAPIFNGGGAADGSGESRQDADVEMDKDDDDNRSQMGTEDQEHEQADDEGLAYSVFGGKPVRSSKRAGARPKKAPAEPEAPRVPPGAFVTEDEHEQEHDPEVAEAEPPSPPPPRQTRRSTATKSSTAKSAKGTKAPATRTRGRAKEQETQPEELSRYLPGSLMESEDGSADEAEDDGDRLAPLPPRQARAATAEGVQTRRRSSRLSSSSDTESKPEKQKAPGRTRAAAGAGRKRRT